MENEVTKAPETQGENTPDLNAMKAEIERLKEENGKLKNAQSNASADASKYKKELQARMSEQERAAAETNELIEQLKAENAIHKRNEEIAVKNAAFLGLGFDEALAREAATATCDNNFDAFIDTFKRFIAERDKAKEAEALRSTPRPTVGATERAVTKEEFAKMKYADRVKLLAEQPELYNQLK